MHACVCLFPTQPPVFVCVHVCVCVFVCVCVCVFPLRPPADQQSGGCLSTSVYSGGGLSCFWCKWIIAGGLTSSPGTGACVVSGSPSAGTRGRSPSGPPSLGSPLRCTSCRPLWTSGQHDTLSGPRHQHPMTERRDHVGPTPVRPRERHPTRGDVKRGREKLKPHKSSRFRSYIHDCPFESCPVCILCMCVRFSVLLGSM